MKLNNKGISLVEIIVSITLIAIIIVFLLTMLLTVRNENERNRGISDVLMNQALIIKEIEKDFINYKLKEIRHCEDADKDAVINNSSIGNVHCLKFIFAEGDNGYLLYYSYKISADSENTMNVVGYRRGDKSVIRETPLAPEEHSGVVNTNCAGSNCVLSINLPVYSKDGDNYGINLSYIGNNDMTFSNSGSNFVFNNN